MKGFNYLYLFDNLIFRMIDKFSPDLLIVTYTMNSTKNKNPYISANKFN